MFTLQVRQSRCGTGRWQWRIADAAGVVVDNNPTIYPTEDDARRIGQRHIALWRQSGSHAYPHPWAAA